MILVYFFYTFVIGILLAILMFTFLMHISSFLLILEIQISGYLCPLDLFSVGETMHGANRTKSKYLGCSLDDEDDWNQFRNGRFP